MRTIDQIRTVQGFNGYLKRNGINVKLVAGDGYYYWLSLAGYAIYGVESVYVYRFREMSVTRWLELAKEADIARIAEEAEQGKIETIIVMRKAVY